MLLTISIQPSSPEANGVDNMPSLTMSEAANQLSSLLDATTEITEQTAQAVGGFVSQLIDVQGTSAQFDEGTSRQLQNSLVKLAAAARTGGSLLQISSPNLNLTAASFASLAELGSPTLGCTSPDGRDATAKLPTGVLDGIEGVDPTLPIAALLYVTTANFHPPPTSSIRPKRRLMDDHSNAGSSNVSASPMVSFSLLQSGQPLNVQGVSEKINISIPFQPSVAMPCLAPMRSTDDGLASHHACSATVECRFWDKAGSRWSTDGCTTVRDVTLGGGDDVEFACSCNHLTDFVIVEFRSDGFFEDVAIAFAAFHGFKSAATQCLASGPDLATLPFGWYAIAAVLSFNVLGLAHAARRDRQDRLRVLDQKRRMSSCTSVLRIDEVSKPTDEGGDPIDYTRSRTQMIADEEEIEQPMTIRSASATALPGQSPPPPSESSIEKEATAASSGATRFVCTSNELNTMASHSLSSPAAHSTATSSALRSSAGRVVRLGFLRGAFAMHAPHKSLEHKPSAKERWSKVAGMSQKQNRAMRTAEAHFTLRASSTSKKVWLAFRSRHTLLAGIVYNGALGYTRSQTVQVLSNSLALELVIVSMTFSVPPPGAPVVIMPIVVVIHGMIAGLICIPGMVLSAWLFDVDVVGRLLFRLLLLPVLICMRGVRSSRRVAQIADSDSLKADSLSSCREDSSSVTRFGKGRRSFFSRGRKREAEDHGAKIGIVGMCLAAIATERHRVKGKRSGSGRIVGTNGVWDRLRLPLGWVLNWIFMLGLLFLFMTYVCEFSAQPHPLHIQRELLWTWGFSITQRFLVNEPLIIIASKLGPKILRSKICYICFSERCIEGSSAFFFSLVNFLRTLAAP